MSNEGTVTNKPEAEHGAKILHDAAVGSVLPQAIDDQQKVAILVPERARLEVIKPDDSRLDAPRRATGTYRTATEQSFIDYVTVHGDLSETGDGATTVWIDTVNRRIVAVFNDHLVDGAGWGDYKAVLQLCHSPEWQRWARHDGEQQKRGDFAEHIEDSLPDIVEPDGAEVLEIAQTLHGTEKASFRDAQRLDNGAVSIKYDVDLEVKGGTNGTLDIPPALTLSLAVFEGEERRQINARMRYRNNGGHLTLGYKLDQADDIVREAIAGVAERLGEVFPRVYLGTPRSIDEDDE